MPSVQDPDEESIEAQIVDQEDQIVDQEDQTLTNSVIRNSAKRSNEHY